MEFSRPTAVAFSSTSRLIAGPVPLRTQADRLCGRLNGLEPDGSTNTSAGLRLALDQITRVGVPKHPRILLLTDGHSDNRSNSLRIAQTIKERGIQLDIVGIGGSPAAVNEEELRAMASKVNGELRYWFIRSAPALVKKFESLECCC